MRDAVRSARRIANRLTLPDPWRVEDLCTHVAGRRQRPIHVIDRPANGDAITAMVISTSAADYVFCREDLQGIHRDHAICHELGHLLAGHTQQQELLATFTVATHTVETMVLHRNCDYGEHREQEAEAIADAIMERVSLRIGGEADRHKQRIINGFGDALR